MRKYKLQLEGTLKAAWEKLSADNAKMGAFRGRELLRELYRCVHPAEWHPFSLTPSLPPSLPCVQNCARTSMRGGRGRRVDVWLCCVR